MSFLFLVIYLIVRNCTTIFASFNMFAKIYQFSFNLPQIQLCCRPMLSVGVLRELQPFFSLLRPPNFQIKIQIRVKAPIISLFSNLFLALFVAWLSISCHALSNGQLCEFVMNLSSASATVSLAAACISMQNKNKRMDHTLLLISIQWI